MKVQPTKGRGSALVKPHETLRKLRERSGLSGAEVSRQLGYASTNGYLQFEYPRMGERLIPADLVTKLLPILVDQGVPPITANELISISDARTLPRQSSPSASTQDNVTVSRRPKGLLLPVMYRVESGVYLDEAVIGHRQYGEAPIAPAADIDISGQFAAAVTGDRSEVLHCVAPDQIGKDERVGKRCVCTKLHGASTLREVILSRIGKNGEPEVGTLVGVVIGSYTRE